MSEPQHPPNGQPDSRTPLSPLAWLLLVPIRFYRKAIAPFLPPMCRFYPSCSKYAVLAITQHGAIRGFYLIVRRLLRCGPWTPPGRDVVPDRFTWRAHPAATMADEAESRREMPAHDKACAT